MHKSKGYTDKLRYKVAFDVLIEYIQSDDNLTSRSHMIGFWERIKNETPHDYNQRLIENIITSYQKRLSSSIGHTDDMFYGGEKLTREQLYFNKKLGSNQENGD